jgi:hypothetical protein
MYENENCEFLSHELFLTDVKSLSSPIWLSFLCKCGNIGEKSYQAFINVPHCQECTNQLIKESINIKLSFEYIKNFVNEKGFTLLTKEEEYKNSKEKLKGICPKNHKTDFYYTSLQKGCICCNICSKISFQKTCIEKYGVENPILSKEIQEKREENSLKKWGFRFPMQHPDNQKKQIISSLKYKEYIFPSGKKTIYQGYENFCLDDLLFKEKISENEIINERGDVPKIEYFIKNKSHIYYCDIYIPKKKLIIEVKSKYTFDLNKEKVIQQGIACKNKGYNYQLRIYNNKGEYYLISDII